MCGERGNEPLAPVVETLVFDAKAGLDPAKLSHVAMKVDCRARATRVSPGIYGVAYYVSADDKRAAAEWLLGATAGRWGGNAMSTYSMLLP